MQKLWKTYYFVALILFIGGVVYGMYAALAIPAFIYTAPFQKTLLDLVLGFVTLTGLYGFVFKKPILHPHLWKVVAIGYLGYELFPLVGKANLLAGAPPVALGAILASLLFAFPEILALFLYGFRSGPVWEQKP